jgi:hypothetical protein
MSIAAIVLAAGACDPQQCDWPEGAFDLDVPADLAVLDRV